MVVGVRCSHNTARPNFISGRAMKLMTLICTLHRPALFNCTMKLLTTFILSVVLFPYGFSFDTSEIGWEEGTTNNENASSKLLRLPPLARTLAGSYILALRDDESTMDALEEILIMDYEATGRIQYVYSSVLVGATVTGVSNFSLQLLLESSHVLSVTPVSSL